MQKNKKEKHTMKKSTRIISAILMVLMLASTFSGFVFASKEEKTVTTVAELIEAIDNKEVGTIKLANDLVLNENVTYTYEDKYVIVKNDTEQLAKINAKTLAVEEGSLETLTKWEPKALKDMTLDGQGHKIVGFYTDGGAMFSDIAVDAKVINLNFVNAFVANTTQANVGLVAQVSKGDVVNVSVDGAVVVGTATANFSHLGGVVGRIQTTNASEAPKVETHCPLVKNVVFNGYVVSSYNGSPNQPSVGGIVGQSFGGKLLNCVNYGDITVLSGNIYGAGGIIGLVEAVEGSDAGVSAGMEGNNYVLNCANFGSLTNYSGTSSGKMGGVIGNSSLYWAANSKAQYINLYNSGDIHYFDSTKDPGKEIVNAGNGLVGNVSGVRSDLRKNQGKAEFMYSDTAATVATAVPKFTVEFSTNEISSISARTAVYRLNRNAGNVEDACAWKFENGKAVLDFGTEPEAPKALETTTEIDAVEFDYVKYYDAEDNDSVSVLSELYETNKDNTAKDNYTAPDGKWRFDRGSHLHKRTAFDSLKAGNSFEITFNGTGIEWHTKYRNVMSGVKIYIDGEFVETLSSQLLSTKDKSIHATGDYVVYGAYDLEKGEHTLRAVALSGSNMVIDYFNVYDGNGVKTDAHEFDDTFVKKDSKEHIHLFKGSQTDGFAGSHVIDDTGKCTVCNEQIYTLVDAVEYDYLTYYNKDGEEVTSDRLEEVVADGKAQDGEHNSKKDADGWKYYGASRYLNSNAFVANKKGSYFEITFTGTGIEWHTHYRAPGKNMANVDIYIDDEKVATLLGTEINPSETVHETNDYTLFSVENLTSGEHTFRAETTTDGQMVVDYLAVYGDPEKKYIPGDVNGDGDVDVNDAIHLLYYLYFGDEYSINQPADINGDGNDDINDAIYLLYNAYFGDDEYPIGGQKDN